MQSSELPERVVPGKFTSENLENGNTRLVGECPHDPIDLTPEQVQIVQNTDPQESDSIERPLLQKLYDLQILVPENSK